MSQIFANPHQSNAADEKIAFLEKKIEEFEKMFGQVMAEDKVVGKVVGGPIERDGVKFYRVQIAGQERICTFDKSYFFDDVAVNIADEVMIIKSHIMAVLPKELCITKAPPEFKHISFDEIGGLKSQLDKIKHTVENPLKNAAIAKKYGVQLIKGLMLYGPPGNGKTLIARAIASLLLQGKSVSDDAFIYIKGAEILSKFVGEAENTITGIFKQAREFSKTHGVRAIIFIDEAEALLPTRGSRKSSDIETTIVPTFLSEMDGFDDNSPMILIATNKPEAIDPAVLREGRIDVKLKIDSPNEADAADIFAIHLKSFLTSRNVNAAKAAKDLFESPAGQFTSGAMIAAIVQGSALRAMNREIDNLGGPEGITQDDIRDMIKSLHYK